MAREIPLIVGAKYYAGADLPFYVSRAMVSNYLENRGFRDVRWHDREEPLPAALDPKGDPQYSNDWEEWAEATYSGTGSGVLSPPASPAWLRVELPAQSAVQSLPAAAPSTPNVQASESATVASSVAPASIVVDSVIAREKRLGSAATVAGGLLVVGSIVWSMLRRRGEVKEQVQHEQ